MRLLRYQENEEKSRHLRSMRKTIIEMTDKLLDDFILLYDSETYSTKVNSTFVNFTNACIECVKQQQEQEQQTCNDPIMFDPYTMQETSHVDTQEANPTPTHSFWGKSIRKVKGTDGSL